MIRFVGILSAREGIIPAFKLEHNELTLSRPALPHNPFDKAGRRFVLLGDESGSFEAWAYPLKLLRNFTFSFFIGSSTRPILGKDIVRYIDVSPEITTLTYTYQSFSVKAHYLVPIKEPGALILLEIDSAQPLKIVCGFLPVLQPMWPAGLGGQYAYWDNDLKAYIISESSRKNHGLIGSPAASGLSYTPAHMLADSPSEFKLEIPDPQAVKNSFVPIFLAGGSGKQEDVIKVYKKLQNDPEKYYLQNLEYFRYLQKDTLQITTPDRKLNLAFSWAKVAFDGLIVDNPHLGRGIVAGLGASGTSGRPGFGWFFSGDAYINSLSLNGYGAFSQVKDILVFTRKWQRKDGKMAHELSQAEGYINWWDDYPYGYIHGDTTPYYIAAVYDYVRMSGDRDFVKESWDSLVKAYDWCLSTDTNKDGLMDNKKAGLGALEYGALTGIESDIYMSAVWVRAASVMPRLAALAGQSVFSTRAEKISTQASLAFKNKFWDKKNRFYAYAFNSIGEQVKEIAPWNAVGLMWQLGTPDNSRSSLRRLCSSELTTDWGIRSISKNSKYYQPLNYNYGAVWPFLNSWVTTALYKQHMPLQGYTLLKATAGHTFTHGLGTVTEVFSGSRHVWPQEAVSHQGFSTAGVTLPLIRGLMGLEGNALDKTVTFAPQFPADWKQVRVNNYRIGPARFSFDYTRDKNKIVIKINSDKADGFTVRLAPGISAAGTFSSQAIDGQPKKFKNRTQGQVTFAPVEFPCRPDGNLAELSLSPGPEILPVIIESRVGDKNQGLKIISCLHEKKTTSLTVEGLAGNIYRLKMLHTDLISDIEGAEIDIKGLKIRIPDGKHGTFIKHSIKINIKD